MDTYELDLVSDSPPIPSEFDTMEYSGGDCSFISPVNSLESFVPFPPSDFYPSSFAFFDHENLQIQNQPVCDSCFQESPLSLFNLHQTESTRFDDSFFFPEAMMQFLHLPDLHSFEQTTTTGPPSFPFLPPPPPPPLPLALPGPIEKPCSSGSDVSERFDSFGKSGFNIPSSSTSASHGPTNRVRRQKIAEKTRSLEKLMPWEKKMDMATLLEEAYKYIKFLQAQITVLRWMPLETAYYGGGAGNYDGSRGGDAGLLRMLNRQQILQVLANSPSAQTSLYRRGRCVFSHEQLLSLKMMAQTQTPRNP